MMEIRAAGHECHRLLAGVDEIRIFLARRRRGSHAEEAVLAVKKDLLVLREVVGDERRQTDAEVDVRAFGNVARETSRELVACPAGNGHAFTAFTMRSRRDGRRSP